MFAAEPRSTFGKKELEDPSDPNDDCSKLEIFCSIVLLPVASFLQFHDRVPIWPFLFLYRDCFSHPIDVDDQRIRNHHQDEQNLNECRKDFNVELEIFDQINILRPYVCSISADLHQEIEDRCVHK